MSHASHHTAPPQTLATALMERLAQHGVPAELVAQLQALLHDSLQRLADEERTVRERTLELQQEIACASRCSTSWSTR